jgi:hypothetical protein
MKTHILITVIIISILTSCEQINTEDTIFKIGDKLEYRYSDIELYDSSTHILYFKTSHPEFLIQNKSTFEFLANGEEIYSGVFYPGYSSSFPSGPYIYSSPNFYGLYALRIEFMFIENGTVLRNDPRNDPRIISALKKYNLLHSGLSVTTNSIVINGPQLTFKFTVTNQDISDLLILDPDKIGPNLFHYFTNGLSIRKLTHEEVFYSNFQPQTPSPWNSLDAGWLSEIKSGESRQFTINYTLASVINPGEYNAFFEFPGLSCQVTEDQLYQNNKRIWLGDVQLTKKIIIQ